MKQPAEAKRRASQSVTLALIGSVGILWGFKSCTKQDDGNDNDDGYSSTQPSPGSRGHSDTTQHYGHPGFFHSSYSSSGSSGFFSHSSSSSSGFSSHSSGTSRGGFGSSGHAHGGS